MSNDPLVSTIIPAYNAKKTIDRAIQSALNQTYSNIEVIVVDDASEDTTVEKIKGSYSSNHVSIIEKDSRTGPAESRNLGIRKSNGTFIALLDADDLWKDRKIEMQLNALSGNSYSLSTTNIEVYNELNDQKFERTYDLSIPAEELIKKFYLYEVVSITPTLIFDREVFDKVGGFPPINYKEDHLFMMRALKKFELIHVEKTLCKRFITEKGYSSPGNRNFQKELKAYETFNEIAKTEFPFLVPHEDEFLSTLYFTCSRHLNLPETKMRKIKYKYLDWNARIQFFLENISLGWLIPFLKKIKKFVNGS